MTSDLRIKYGLRWYQTRKEAAAEASTPRSGPSHRNGVALRYVTSILRLSPDGPYSSIAISEPTKDSDNTVVVLNKNRGGFQRVKFHKVTADLYQLDNKPLTIEVGDAPAQTEAS